MTVLSVIALETGQRRRIKVCHVSCLIFGEDRIEEVMVKDKRVLEVGSKDLNGSLREFVESMEPRYYVGIDIDPGKGVDIVLNAENLIEHFGPDSFDLVISTEMLEHVKNWREVVYNLKTVVAPGGVIILTTRAPGFAKHEHPGDYWRYTVGDLHFIFEDFHIIEICEDWEQPGTFIYAIKPSGWVNHDVSKFQLFKVE